MERGWQDRVYSETLPWEELVRPETLGLLARYRLELVLAVRPWDAPRLVDTAKALRDAGVALSIWPMVADEHGRWANVQNAHEFRSFALTTCDQLQGAGVPPRDLLFDMEPPFAQARALASLAARAPKRPPALGRASSAEFEAASAELAQTTSEIATRGIGVSAAVWPLVALDPKDDRTWQRTLGTPVDPLGAAHVSVMMYTSIIEGWSRGAVRRRDARLLLAAATMRAARRWNGRAGMSLGCVGVGAFEDEPTYRDPSELAEDVAIARTAGCDRLSLFDLGGVLARGPAEAWLDAFTSQSVVAVGPSTKRVDSARIIARAATWALGRRR